MVIGPVDIAKAEIERIERASARWLGLLDAGRPDWKYSHGRYDSEQCDHGPLLLLGR